MPFSISSQFAYRLWRRIYWAWHKRSLQKKIGTLGTRSVSKPPIFFFLPEADTDPHFQSSLYLAKALSLRGHEVLVGQCYSLFNRCPVLLGVSRAGPISKNQKEITCTRCLEKSICLSEKYDLPTVDMRTLLTQNDLAEARDLIWGAKDAELFDLKFREHFIGRVALQTLVLSLKVSDPLKMDSVCIEAWREQIYCALVGYLCTERIIKSFRPSAIVHYNEYSASQGVRLASSDLKSRAVYIGHANHRNIDRRTPWIFSRSVDEFLMGVEANWNKYKQLPVPPDWVEESFVDLVGRLSSQGFTVYSPTRGSANKTFHELGFSNDRKLVTAFTSSLDEISSISAVRKATYIPLPNYPNAPFDNQIEWLKALVKWFGASPTLQLAIRIHPREGKDRRNGGTSQHLKALQSALVNLPHNIRVVWPTDPISSYDLAEMSELILTSWSGIGNELARLGMPVIATHPWFNYVPINDFTEFADNEKDYFVLIEKRLETFTKALHNIRQAHRWHYHQQIAPGVDLRDILRSPDSTLVENPSVPKEIELIEAAILRGEFPHTVNVGRQMSLSGTGGLEAEIAALKRGILEMMQFLISGKIDRGQIQKCPNPMVTLSHGKVELVLAPEMSPLNGESPMLRRLAQAYLELLREPTSNSNRSTEAA